MRKATNPRNIKMNNPPLHGNENFDRKYFGAYYKKYNHNELTKAYRWFKGWIRLIDQIYYIKDGSGKKALEVGCGIGAFSKIIKERGFIVYSSDISEFIINRAKKLQKGINFKVENIERVRAKKNEFDFIFAFEVLEHLKNPEKALNNLKGRLRKNGVLIFSSPCPTKETLADPTHINVHLPNYWLSIGKKSGFKTQNMRYASFIPFLYRFHHLFSRAIPFRINLPYINNTCFFFFEKK